MDISGVLSFFISDVRGWSFLLIGIGVASLFWVQRIHGEITSRAMKASILAAFPGACFLVEMCLFRGNKELYSLFTFGPALVWIGVGFIALIKSLNLWPLSGLFGGYQVLRILNAIYGRCHLFLRG